MYYFFYSLTRASFPGAKRYNLETQAVEGYLIRFCSQLYYTPLKYSLIIIKMQFKGILLFLNGIIHQYSYAIILRVEAKKTLRGVRA